MNDEVRLRPGNSALDRGEIGEIARFSAVGIEPEHSISALQQRGLEIAACKASCSGQQNRLHCARRGHECWQRA